MPIYTSVTEPVSVDDNGGSLTVDATALPLPSGASTSANQSTGNASLSSIDGKTPSLGQALAAASSPVVLTAAQITTITPPAAITNFANETGGNLANAAASLSVMDDWDETDRAKVNTIAGQVGVQGGSGVVTDLTQRTVLATDVALPAGTNTVGKVDQGVGGASAWKMDGSAVTQPVSGPLTDTQLRASAVPVSGTISEAPATSGGLSIYRNLDVNATGVNIKSSAGQIYALIVTNDSSTVKFLKIYNKASAPTVGTDTPVMTVAINANTQTQVDVGTGIAFNLGIGIGATTGVADANSSAPNANNIIANVLYK